MPFARFLSSPRRLLPLFALAALSFAGVGSAQGQSLRFVPTLSNVASVNPTLTTTTLNSPGGVATDLAGNLYIVETPKALVPAKMVAVLVGSTLRTQWLLDSTIWMVTVQ